jgi:hypothetical protein
VTGVKIAAAGAVCAAGVGIDALEAWAKNPTAHLGPMEHLDEPWMPVHEGGVVPGWSRKVARAHMPDRKALKLMTRPVQFGVAAALEAWPEALETGPVERRGMYVGSAVAIDEDWTFRDPINAAIVDGVFDMVRFAGPGHDVLNPLWLVRGLSNNVLAFTALFRNIQGPNDNFEAGEAGPLIALATATEAIRSGRADVALAGGSDSLCAVEHLFHHHRHGDDLIPGEAAAFVRLEPGESGDFGVLAAETGFVPGGPQQGPGVPRNADEACTAMIRRAHEAADVPLDLLLTGPRLWALSSADPNAPTPCLSNDLLHTLGDAGAGSGALLLALAWTQRSDETITLAACGPGGELAVVILGPLP